MNKVKISLVAGIVAGMLAGGAIGASAQDETSDAQPATWVTGEIWYAPSCRSATLELVGDVRQERGYRCHPQTWKSDDPRFGGDGAESWNADVYVTDAGQISIISKVWDVRGETGGWQCTKPTGLSGSSGLFATDVQATDRLVCTGDGDNEGLTAVLTATWTSSPKTFEGLIIAGEPAPVPDF